MSVPLSSNSILSQSLGCLLSMLGDSQTWRALVAQPNVEWADLATLIAAQTSPQAAALAAIRLGILEDDPDHADYLAAPRIGLRHPDSADLQRLSTTGFVSSLVLIATCEFPIPDAYLESHQDAYVDALNKLGGVLSDLKALGRTAGYLDLVRIQVGPSGLIDPDQNNDLHWFGGELLVEGRGI